MHHVFNTFKFPNPLGYNSILDGGRLIFHGPNRAEFIVSGVSVQGRGTTGDLAEIHGKLLQNAEASIRRAAAHPALTVTQYFQQALQFSKVDCWTLLAETKERDVDFFQAVVSSSSGVLIITFESAKHPQTQCDFEQFLHSIEPE